MWPLIPYGSSKLNINQTKLNEVKTSVPLLLIPKAQGLHEASQGSHSQMRQRIFLHYRKLVQIIPLRGSKVALNLTVNQSRLHKAGWLTDLSCENNFCSRKGQAYRFQLTVLKSISFGSKFIILFCN